MSAMFVLLGLALLVIVRADERIYCGHDLYCTYGCCEDSETLRKECCSYSERNEGQPLSAVAVFGIVSGVVVFVVLYVSICCWCRSQKKRRSGVILIGTVTRRWFPVVSRTNTSTNPAHAGYDQPDPETSGIANTNPAHAGYDQEEPTGSNLKDPSKESVAPPPYSSVVNHNQPEPEAPGLANTNTARAGTNQLEAVGSNSTCQSGGPIAPPPYSIV